jgi:SAM-dependent methyltransferase
MKISIFYHLLNFPVIYSLSQKILAPGVGYLCQKHYKNIFSESRDRILDIGCGPLLTTPAPDGITVGIDINPLYVKKYRNNKNRLGLVCLSNSLPFDDDIFDETRCVGLLHHLSTESASSTIMEMIRCTRAEGQITIIDSVWPLKPILRPAAWLIRRFDRGKWVRTEDELLKLVRSAYSRNWHSKRFTYSYTGLEALSLTTNKPINGPQ